VAAEDLLRLVDEWAREELEYASRLRELAGRIRHPVLRALFEGIAKDSEKHHYFLKAMGEYLRDNRPLVTEEDLQVIGEAVEKHVREEKESIVALSELREKVDDPALLLIIDAMLEDEKRHHKLLSRILEVVARGEAVSDQELWEALWRDTPYHGAPG